MSRLLRRISTRHTRETLPNFLIIGAPRCGTTALARYLASHPDVFMASEKEVRFFNRDFHLGLEWYRARFADVTFETAIGEATPGYMFSDAAIERMGNVLPDARLIAILRNPVDRAYSHYWMRRAHGEEHRSFEDAVVEELRSRGTRNLLTAPDAYLERGRYLHRLTRVCERYPRDRLKVITLEDLRDEPRNIYAAICGFLGVDVNHLPANLGRPVNDYVRVRSPLVRKLTAGFPHPVRRVVGRLNVSRVSYPPMEAPLRRQLLDLFRAENGALGEWLNRDIAIWSE